VRLAAWSAAFVLGVAAALSLDFVPGKAVAAAAFWTLAGSAALLMAAIAVRGGRTAALLAPLGVLLFAGALLGGRELGSRDRAVPAGAPAAPGEAVVEGVLLEDPAPAAGGTRLRLRVEAVYAGGERHEARFDAAVFADRLAAPPSSARPLDGFRYGDRYRVQGRWRPEDHRAGLFAGTLFAKEAVLTGEDGGNAVRRRVAGLRQRMFDSIRRAVGGDAGALSAAMVVGDRRGISPELTEAFRKAGTAHLLAISGMNIALVGGMALAAGAVLVGRRWQVYLLVPLATAWGYGALAGFSPSVVRATVMFTVYVAAYALGRQRSALPALGLAAAVMVALDPGVLGSISFQLSFAAVAGIAVIGPGIADACRRGWMRVTRSKEPPAGMIEAVIFATAIGIGATAATAPLFLFHFGTFATWSIVSTMLSAPALGLLIISAALAGALGLAWPAAAQVAGWPAWLTGEYIANVSRFFAWAPPGAVETGRWAAPASVALYAALVAWLSRRWLLKAWRIAGTLILALLRKRRAGAEASAEALWRPPAWLIGLAFVAAAIVWTGAITSRPDGLVKVTFFETDNGDAIFIETPNGTQALIDGGRAVNGAVRSVDARLPFWDRSLDLVLLTHGDQDHVGGLEAVLERFDVALVADAPLPPETDVYRSWLRAAEGRPNRVKLSGGEIIALDDRVALEVLSAGPMWEGAPENDSAVVTRLRYGGVTVLLTSDISCAGEAWALASGADLKSTALKVAHHGSGSSSCEPFLKAVKPAVAVVQAGARNVYGHPHEEALARLRAVLSNENIFITKDRGDVTLVTDGTRLWVETER
jgi:competence protein ComEC